MFRMFFALLIYGVVVHTSLAFENDFNPIVEQDGNQIIVYIPNHYQDQNLRYVHLNLNDENGERIFVTLLKILEADDLIPNSELYSMVVFVAPDKTKLEGVSLSVSYNHSEEGVFSGCITTKEIRLLDIL